MPSLRPLLMSLLLLAVAAPALAQQPIRWLHDWRQARDLAQQQQRLVLLHFWSTTCPPCKKLDQEVFNQTRVARAMSTGYIPVKINVTESPELARHYRVSSVPTDIIVDKNGRELHRTISPQDPNRYVAMLDQVKAHTGAGMQTPPSSFAQSAPAGTRGLPPRGQPPSSLGTQTQSASGYSRDSDFPAQARQTPVGDLATRGDRDPQQRTPYAGGGGVRDEVGAAPQSASLASPYGNRSQPEPSGNPWTRSNPASPSADASGSPATRGYGTQPATGDYGQLDITEPRSGPRANPHLRPGSQARQDTGRSAPSFNTQDGSAAAGQLAARARPAPSETGNTQLPWNAPGANPAGGGNTPKFALEGYCPVSLIEQNDWQPGDPRWGARHMGRVYLFVDQSSRDAFLRTPHRYSPVLAGFDPVRYLESGAAVEGRREYGLIFGDHYYLFADEAALQRFQSSPQRYSQAALQATRNWKPSR